MKNKFKGNGKDKQGLFVATIKFAISADHKHSIQHARKCKSAVLSQPSTAGNFFFADVSEGHCRHPPRQRRKLIIIGKNIKKYVWQRAERGRDI
jgi:hypothetical protein